MKILKIKSIILIKLGGSIITQKDKEYTFIPDVVKRLAKEIKRANIPVLIAHGGGSYPHTSAKKYGGAKGYISTWGIAKVARDAMEINRLVMDVLLDEKIPAVSFRPMSMILANKGKVSKKMFEPILEALNQGLIPVIYGDVIWDKTFKSTIFSGEKTLNLVAEYLLKNKYKVEKIIEVGTTDGVLDANGKTINVITKRNLTDIKKIIFVTKNDVTGGMIHKIEEAIKIAQKGIFTYIINGKLKNELLNCLTSKKVKGTIIK